MEEPLLDKMQALMGKYHAPTNAVSDVTPLVIPDCDTAMTFPILTDIVKLGDAVFHDPQPETPPAQAVPAPASVSADTVEQIALQVLSAVDMQLQTQVNQLIAPRLQQAMDETLALLLPQLTINIENIIHEALVKEFAHHGIPLNRADDSV
ncbi:hypothetical protein [Sulfuriferula thiophila]|uniref:hypothetical protein n=1 Tax=Sulfuriferula thiophila TaxID=1781211 RepID=UPI000F612080|nr:hypothetical protein [Sulfuriferula thiophila]